ncbi:MAG: hypothetical protein NTV34_15715 [Proteobacteria bacterium]|nr:hypothetical protein [Pseudomonadota bacterium]
MTDIPKLGDTLIDKGSIEKSPVHRAELGKILEFRPRAHNKPARKPTADATSINLLKVSDEIDALIMHHVQTGNVDLRDLAGLLSHRLGTLMNHIEDKKELLPLCLKVLRRQAKVD